MMKTIKRLSKIVDETKKCCENAKEVSLDEMALNLDLDAKPRVIISKGQRVKIKVIGEGPEFNKRLGDFTFMVVSAGSTDTEVRLRLEGAIGQRA